MSIIINENNIDEIKKILEEYENKKQIFRNNANKWYKKKYVITDDMTDEQKQEVRDNIEKRKIKEKEKYEKNKEYYAQKSKQYRERKKQKSN
jgi:hypothetical protein